MTCQSKRAGDLARGKVATLPEISNWGTVYDVTMPNLHQYDWLVYIDTIFPLPVKIEEFQFELISDYLIPNLATKPH